MKNRECSFEAVGLFISSPTQICWQAWVAQLGKDMVPRPWAAAGRVACPQRWQESLECEASLSHAKVLKGQNLRAGKSSASREATTQTPLGARTATPPALPPIPARSRRAAALADCLQASPDPGGCPGSGTRTGSTAGPLPRSRSADAAALVAMSPPPIGCRAAGPRSRRGRAALAPPLGPQRSLPARRLPAARPGGRGPSERWG